MMYFTASYLQSLFVITLIAIRVTSSLSVPAGLRPAKQVGDPKQQIMPQQEQQQHQETALMTQPAPKIPPNLSLRSRMMAALSASPNPSSKEDISKVETNDAPKPPTIFLKNHKKASDEKATFLPKENVRIVHALPPDFGNKNYGLNTVLQTNLVDSQGRVMKNVNAVPIKVPSFEEVKNTRTRHLARQVESDADKIIPIKFGSASRRQR